MANWQTEVSKSGFNAGGQAQSLMDQRDQGREGSAVDMTTTTTGHLWWKKSTTAPTVTGEAMAGVNANEAQNMMAAIENYVKSLQDKIEQIDADAKSDKAVKGDAIQTALTNYINKVKSYCSDIVDYLKAYNDKLEGVMNKWVEQTKKTAEKIDASAGQGGNFADDIGSGYQYQSGAQYTVQGGYGSNVNTYAGQNYGGVSGQNGNPTGGTGGTPGQNGNPTGGAGGTSGQNGNPTGGADGTSGQSGNPTGGTGGVPDGGNSGTGSSPNVKTGDQFDTGYYTAKDAADGTNELPLNTDKTGNSVPTNYYDNQTGQWLPVNDETTNIVKQNPERYSVKYATDEAPMMWESGSDSVY